MASKSKRRGRVFRASCILAALIIAGSSFAWFTSRDEVTNRLSASGDYDVSIVESFAPPTKWLPGQEVNKDVYAVNTGDVDAFVKETVSSVLTITTEEAYNGDSGKPVPGESIELSSAERYVKEAGSFLVYKPTGSEKELGTEIVSMTPGATEDGYASAGTDFTPDVEGLYVFRRTIDVDKDTHGETFKYEAYYYVPGRDATPAYPAVGNPGDAAYKPAIDAQPAVPGKYYKVSNLKTTVLDPTTTAGDNVQDDGIVVANPAPTYGFYKDVTKTIVPTLTYDSVNNRLVATYDTTKSLNDLKALAKAYEDASIAWEDAKEELAAAMRDQGDGSTTGASGTLAQKKQALETAMNELGTAKTNMDNAWTNYETALNQSKTLKTASETAAKNLQDAKDELGINGDSATANTLYGKLKKATDDLGTATNAANTKMDERDTALTARNAAQDAVTNAAQDSRNAFLDFVIAKVNSDADATNNIDTTQSIDNQRNAAITYINNLTYAQMQGLGIENTDPGWAFYQLQLDLKDKQDKLDKAEAAYQAALQAKTNANNAKLAAQKAVTAKEAEIGNVGDGADNTNNSLTALAERAQAAYVAKMEELYGITSGDNYGVNGSTTEGEYTETSFYGVYKAREADYNDANRNYAEKLADYNAAAGVAGNADSNVAAAQNYVAQTKKAMDDAKAAYEAATTNPDAKKLKIYINLADVTTETGKENKWQLLPTSLEDKYVNATTVEGTDAITDTASFYYTGILGGGETTSKLIDSIVLDENTTQDMFKYFDFDLNVTLNSAQVNIDRDGNYTAETAKSELGKNAALSVPNADAIVTWSEDAAPTPSTSATNNTYTGTDGAGSYTITELYTPKSIDYVDYTYELVSGDDKYYANDKVNGTDFYKFDTATNKLSTTEKITLTVDATPVTP